MRQSTGRWGCVADWLVPAKVDSCLRCGHFGRPAAAVSARHKRAAKCFRRLGRCEIPRHDTEQELAQDLEYARSLQYLAHLEPDLNWPATRFGSFRPSGAEDSGWSHSQDCASLVLGYYRFPLRGKEARFSIDALVNIASALERRVTVRLEDAA